jgi:Spy/CpxP family protein refolding chaperone
MVNKQRFKAYGLLIGVFLLGSVAGAGASYGLLQQDYREFASGKREPFERRRLHALSSELGLSADQEQRIRVIFRKHRAERLRLVRDMHERCGEPLRQHKVKLDSEIRSVLTPEQRPHFQELLQRHEKWFGERRRRR